MVCISRSIRFSPTGSGIKGTGLAIALSSIPIRQNSVRHVGPFEETTLEETTPLLQVHVPLYAPLAPGQEAVVTTVEEVDDETQNEPDDETDPGVGSQAHDEDERADDADRGHQGHQRGAVAALHLRAASAQDDDSGADQDEGGQDASVDELGERHDRDEAGE